MTRMSRLLGTATIMLMSGIAVSDLHSQSGTGRALIAYPMKGQTLEQENADRAACHDWAVTQTGYDPTLVYAAQQYWIEVRPGANAGASYEHPRYPHNSGGFVGAMGNAERRRLNELYDAYLRAGQVCLEARGYQVSR
jgi:hypothetical protein